MLDRFREWLSDNLRYLLLGLSIVLLLVIAFFTIRLITRIGSDEKKPEMEQMTEDGSEAQGQVSKTENKLKKEPADSPLHQLVEKYYKAATEKDYDTVDTLNEDEKDRKEIREDSAIESYNNIITYSKAGMTDGTYVVYVYFEAKIEGIQTLAPRLAEMYVISDAEGGLKFGDRTGSTALENYMKELAADDDVQALVSDVNTQLSNAMAQDGDLKTYVKGAYKSGQVTDGTDETDETDGDTDGSGAGAQTGTMKANTVVNVRAQESAESTLYGTLPEGMEVEVLENLSSGWSHIRYTQSNGTVIEGYVMTQYLSPAG